MDGWKNTKPAHARSSLGHSEIYRDTVNATGQTENTDPSNCQTSRLKTWDMLANEEWRKAKSPVRLLCG